jgi:hypothetical protein
MDQPSEDRRQWVSSPNAGKNGIPAQLPRPPRQTFQDYVSLLDPVLRALVSDVDFVLPLDKIIPLFATTTLTLVGAGGAKTCHGSDGVVAALDSIRIVRIKGPVTGPDPRSYRAEAHAMSSIIIFVVLLHQCVPHHETRYSAMDLFSDNQSLVETITKMYPPTALESEWDIISVNLTYIPLLPLPPTVQHVKSHKYKGVPVLSLPLPAQLNCEADALATAALLAIAAPLPLSCCDTQSPSHSPLLGDGTSPVAIPTGPQRLGRSDLRLRELASFQLSSAFHF